MNTVIFVVFACILSAIPVQSISTATVFETKSLPQDYLMASVGNGYIATVIYSDTIYLSGLFNGRGKTAPSHRARIPSTCDIKVRTNAHSEQELWSLDVYKGVFNYSYTAVNFTLEQKVYSHRVREHVIVSEVSVSNSLNEDIEIAFDTNFNPTSQDIDFKMISPSRLRVLELNQNTSSSQNGYKAMQGYIKETEEPDSPSLGVAVVWTEVPRDPITVPRHSSNKRYFVTAISSSLNTQDFLQDAYKSYVSALNDLDGLLVSHVEAWKEIWDQGRVEMDGHLPLAQAVYGSLYYILRYQIYLFTWRATCVGRQVIKRGLFFF
jgi:trehalose/maltose hydrolase-like predicted phosphorylase